MSLFKTNGKDYKKPKQVQNVYREKDQGARNRKTMWKQNKKQKTIKDRTITDIRPF